MSSYLYNYDTAWKVGEILVAAPLDLGILVAVKIVKMKIWN
jgi:hypothetical protein